MPIATHGVVVNAPIDRVFDVITDFANYPKFLPEMERVDVHKSGERAAEVFFLSNLIKKVNYTLSFNLKRPTHIAWKMIDGDAVIRKNAGTWKLKKIEPNRTNLIFTVDMQLNLWVPTVVADGLTKARLPQMLQNFKKRAEET